MEFFKDDKIKIRNAVYEDVDFIVNLENLEENSPYIYSESKEDHIKDLNGKNRKHFTIETLNGEKIGYFIMNDLENKNYNITLQRFVISQKGNGYGRRALKGIKKISFCDLNAHRLWLDVREYNENAIKLYKSEGFKVEGHFIESVYLNGKYVSEYVMAITKGNYLY